MSTKKQISQKPAKNTRTTARTTKKNIRNDSSTKSTPRPVRAQFKAGKDL